MDRLASIKTLEQNNLSASYRLRWFGDSPICLLMGLFTKLNTDIDNSDLKDYKLICNKGIEYEILDGKKYFDVECWAKIANVTGSGKVRIYIQ